jgi:transposase
MPRAPKDSKALRKPGRPSSYTRELGKQLCKLVEAGNFLDTAAATVGIAKSTLFLWLRRGARERRKGAQTELAHFSAEMEMAEARAETRNVLIVGMAAEKQWQAAAWMLERRHRERWSRNTLELTGPDGAAGIVFVLPPEKPE